jgi:hypothetical protein
VSGERHKENINQLANDLTAEFGNILCKGKFRIGIAQKALNLYLKYLWCMDQAALPPNCPFDSGIIGKLPLTPQQKRELEWTRLDRMDGYQALVEAGEKKIKETGDPSMAEWELRQWA